jgi:predicted TIM-barrel fold metal-dependent hydrolase
MIIDTHTHLLGTGHWPAEWWNWVADDWASQKAGRKPSAIRDRIEPGLVDPGGRRMVARMDAAGVDKSVLLPIDWGPDFSGTIAINEVVDEMLALADVHSGRFVPFAGIDPRRPDAVELVTGWFERGAQGLKLYPSCGWDPRDDSAMAVYEVCDRYRRPVLFHTGHPLPVLDAEQSNPLLLADVVRTFPALPVWLGHAGAPVWWDEALEVARAGSAVRLEMSVWLWDDSDAETERAFAKKVLEAGETVGFDRVLFGTDHVSGARVRADDFLATIVAMYDRLPEHIAELGGSLTDADIAAIMGGTAASDLGL